MNHQLKETLKCFACVFGTLIVATAFLAATVWIGVFFSARFGVTGGYLAVASFCIFAGAFLMTLLLTPWKS